MASYHFSVQKPISRAKGQSLLAKAAYNGRTQYRDERTGELTKDYSYKKDEHVKSFVAFDPKTNAPAWVKDDRQRLLNAAVAAETRKDAREGQQIIIGLIHELGPEKSQWMLNDFIREQFTRGTRRVVIVDIHRAPDHGDERNAHAHVILLPREILPDGSFGERLPELTPQGITHLREKWAEKGAKELRKAGYELEADRFAVAHLKLEKQREAALARDDHEWAKHLDREAQEHRGPAADAMERKGQDTERGDPAREIEELPALEAQLSEVNLEIWGIEHEAKREIEWQDALAQAAIDNEKTNREFVEPKSAELEADHATVAQQIEWEDKLAQAAIEKEHSAGPEKTSDASVLAGELAAKALDGASAVLEFSIECVEMLADFLTGGTPPPTREQILGEILADIEELKRRGERSVSRQDDLIGKMLEAGERLTELGMNGFEMLTDFFGGGTAVTPERIQAAIQQRKELRRLAAAEQRLEQWAASRARYDQIDRQRDQQQEMEDEQHRHQGQFELER